MSDCDQDTSVPDWVIDHPEVLPVFERLGIDYSCGGKSLEYACNERGLDVRQVLGEINEAIRMSRKCDA